MLEKEKARSGGTRLWYLALPLIVTQPSQPFSQWLSYQFLQLDKEVGLDGGQVLAVSRGPQY